MKRRAFYLIPFIFMIGLVKKLTGQTKVGDDQVSQPVGANAFWIRTPTGRIFAVPDPSIIIDTSTIPPSVRAVGSGVSFIDNQVPSGVIDGINKIFTLSTVPAVGSLHLFRNGLLQKLNTDFSLSGNQITFLASIPAPGVGTLLLASYRV